MASSRPTIRQITLRWLPIAGILLGVALIVGVAIQVYAATHPTPHIIGQNCGMARQSPYQAMPVPTPAPSDAAAINCLWQAYQQCHSATLVATTVYVDTGIRHYLTVQAQGGRCTVHDVADNFVVPGHHDTITAFTCAGLRQSGAGLVAFGCGAEGDVTIP